MTSAQRSPAMAAREAPALSVRSLSKGFAGHVALDHVDLDLERGAIHAVVGENGAGKSTLIKILAGVYAADEGRITIRGQEAAIRSPRDARSFGLGFLHQQLHLVEERSIRENLYLTSRYPRRASLVIDWRRAGEHASRLLTLVGLEDLDPRTPVAELPLAQRQLVALARTLQDEPAIIVLDEPTSALGEEDTRHLIDVVLARREAGASVLFVSHRLDEVVSIADTVSILRDGRLVETLAKAEMTREKLVALMGGRSSEGSREVRLPPLAQGTDATGARNVLRVTRLTGPGLDHPVTFRIARGEVLGLAGLVGSGRSTLASMLAGGAAVRSGTIELEGRPVVARSRQDALASGIVLVPSDRSEALVLDFTVEANITLGHVERYAAGGVVLRKRQQRERASELAQALEIRGAKGDSRVRYMSGGNQQKVLLARAIDRAPRVLLLDEPTAGVDVATKEYIYTVVRKLARDGVGVLFVSSELEELPRVCDRILIFSRGRILDELSGATDRATIVERLFEETDRAGTD